MGACCYGGSRKEKSRAQRNKARPHTNDHQLRRPRQAQSNDGASSPQSKVNINTAKVYHLCTLEGIDRQIAEGIVNYRSVHGPFTSIQDLLSVPGIDHKLLKRLQTLVVCTREEREKHDRHAPVNADAINHETEKKQEGSIRIGSWNLKCFSVEKASNDGYCEVLCMVILENG